MYSSFFLLCLYLCIIIIVVVVVVAVCLTHSLTLSCIHLPIGLMVVMGATAALSATPGMLGYGLSKSASHHFVQTLGACTGTALTKNKKKTLINKKIRKNNEYLDDLTVVGILPTMIDTASNRGSDPTADFAQWTKPMDIAREIGTWIEKPPLRPHSGSLVKVMPHPENVEGAFFQLVR